MKMNLHSETRNIPLELLYIASQLRMKRIRYKELAKKLNVNASLISHVLNGTGKSDRILEKLRKIVGA